MKVALVSPPWGELDAPSLTCSILKPLLEASGAECSVTYLSLALAAELGADDYAALADETQFLGDAVFAPLLDDAGPRNIEKLSQMVSRRHPLGGSVEDEAVRLAAAARRAAAAAARLVDSEVVRALADADAAILVCERDVFNQALPAAAIARRIKDLSPETKIVLTGLGLEGPPAAAFLDAFPWLDWIAQGDAEAVLPPLLAAIASGAPAPDGALSRGGESDRYGLLRTLDDLPVPDFDDYFAAARAARRRGLLLLDVALPFEGSRGCWWGRQSHCRFCDLNDATIAERRKSAERLAEELAEQSRRYKAFRFRGRDNIIAREHVCGLPPLLGGLDLTIFLEMKPTLSKDEVAGLARAGVVEIQSGVETFSTRLLRKSAKGVSAAQNVAFMKWAKHSGVDLRWYMLHGFPGETTEDYQRLLRLIPRLRHFQPPVRLRRVVLLRGSPYFDAHERFGFRNVRPFPEYEEILPSSRLDWARAARCFDHTLDEAPPHAPAVAKLAREVALWTEAWRSPRPPELELRRGEGFCEILDSRAGGGLYDVTRLEGDDAWAYEACADAPVSARDLAQERGLDPARLERRLLELESKGLVWEEEGKFLSLALPYPRNSKKYDIVAIYRPASSRSRGSSSP